MDAQKWQRVKHLVAEAGERPQADRERFLAERCDDPALRAEILEILAADVALTDIVADAARTSTIGPGTRLGGYAIADVIGRGGMGVVYRATDTRLRREVAIKVLPSVMTAAPDRLARLRQEAQLLASLNHPNICAIYGLEEADGICALVLEYVDGKTLAERLLQRGVAAPLPIEETIRIARQLVDALDAAHQRGIVHRDLKPANIKITTSGDVKVLDFGLGKAADSSNADDQPVTEAGMILGTAQYMSPEQARGQRVDKRTDIWAFGCVLFEMIAGRRVFNGETTTDVLAAVVTESPDWAALPGGTPDPLRRLLRRCLEKDRVRRLQDIGDARFDLDEASLAEPPQPAPRRSRVLHPAVGAAAIAAPVAVAFLIGRSMPGSPATPRADAVGQVTISLPADVPLSNFDLPAVAVSPDGTRVVFVAGAPVRHLYLRALDDVTPHVLPGTDGASSPFFAPDGRSVAFFTGSLLKKVSVDGGDPIVVCACRSGNPRGGAWSVDGTIAYAPAPGTALFRVSADGGAPQPLTKLDTSRGEGSHHWPSFLPNGKAILYTVGTGSMATWDEREIVVQSLVTGAKRTVAHGTAARYVSTGHLVVEHGGALLAIPFDKDRLEATGPPVRVLESVMFSPLGAAQFDTSQTGTVVYVPGDIVERELVLVSRTGEVQTLPAPRRTYWSVRRSPDERRLAVGIESANYGVWSYDLARGTMTRLTFDGTNAYPIWTPDGTRITHNSTKSSGVLNLFWRPADGSGDDERLTTSDGIQIPDSWSPDGRYLAYQSYDSETGRDIWIFDRTGERQPWPYLRSRFDEGGAAFSPDGQSIAYVSNESGTTNVYVRPFRGAGEKWQISTEGGSGPVWGTDRRELFFLAGRRMMVVDVENVPAFRAGKPRVLFEAAVEQPIFQANYDVSADGQRFYMIRTRPLSAPVTQLHLALNWIDASLRRARQAP